MDDFNWMYALIGSASVVFGGAVWALRRTFASTERVEKIENRLTEIETRCAAMPDAAVIQEIRLQQAEMNGDLKALNRSMNSISHQLDLLLENAVTRRHQ